jgi:RNA polymerase sigma factor (sigma-70 family)
MRLLVTLTAEKAYSKMTQDSEMDFEAIFKEQWNRIHVLLYRIVGDWAEAEDLALDTFLRLYHRPPRDRRNLTGWLYRVATRLGLNAIRSRNRRQRYEQEAGFDNLEKSSPGNPALTFERQQEKQQVRETLQGMPERSAQILILRHSGLSYAEIAAAIGVSPNSVGTLLARAEAEFESRYRKIEGD